MRRAVLAATVVIAGAALAGPLPAGAATSATTTTTTISSSSTRGLTPIFECAAPNSDGTFTAFYGYTSTLPFSLPIPVSVINGFSPSPTDRGQPSVFAPGRHVAVFSVRFKPSDTVSWRLGIRRATASSKTLCSTPAELSETSSWLALPGTALISIGVWAFVQRRRRRSDPSAPTPLLAG